MSDPIFILGMHRSGTSVVAGLLYHACGVSMGELMPPTEDNPLGYFEALDVVEAHREILGQLERDWTCPPTTFRPGMLDLSALAEQADVHKALPGVWAMKDPRSLFLLPAWDQVGVERARLVAVVRPPGDTIKSIEKRDGIREDLAEAIVDAYLRRLLEVAQRIPLPVVQFPGEGHRLIEQVRRLAAALDLPWDEGAATAFFDESLVRNRSPLKDSSPTYDKLLQAAQWPKKVPPVNLRGLKLASEPEWPLVTHLGPRHGRQRNELWGLAHFSTHPEPEVVEILLEGARPGGSKRAGVKLHQIQVGSPMAVGATLMRDRLRPQGVVGHSLLAGRSINEIEFLFRSLYINTDPMAELLLDVPDPRGKALLNSTPPPVDSPQPARVVEVANRCGWDHQVTERLSPGRSGMFFRKRIVTDSDLVPVVTDLLASLLRIHTIDQRLATMERRLEREGVQPHKHGAPMAAAVVSDEVLRNRVEAAERELDRLRSRRSVRLALAITKPTKGLFRMVRSWKKKR